LLMTRDRYHHTPQVPFTLLRAQRVCYLEVGHGEREGETRLLKRESGRPTPPLTRNNFRTTISCNVT